jgi:hypothetical protein
MVYVEDTFHEPQTEERPIEHKPQKSKRRLIPRPKFTMLRWFFYGGVCAVLVYGAIVWFAYGQVKDILGEF